jgi:hypothetical protein
MAQLIGRSLMVGLGLYFLLYSVRPHLPIVRSLSWGHADIVPEPIIRAGSAVLGTLLIVAGLLV